MSRSSRAASSNCSVFINYWYFVFESEHKHVLECRRARTDSHSHSNSGNPLAPYNWREKIIRQIHSLNHFCGFLSYSPPGAHQLKHYTSHYVPVICNPASLLFPLYLSWSVSVSPSIVRIPLCFLKISVTAPLSVSQNPVSSFEELIKSKNERLGPGFCLWNPRLSIVLDRPLETVIRGGILLIRRSNKAERPRWWLSFSSRSPRNSVEQPKYSPFSSVQ